MRYNITDVVWHMVVRVTVVFLKDLHLHECLTKVTNLKRHEEKYTVAGIIYESTYEIKESFNSNCFALTCVILSCCIMTAGKIKLIQ